MDVRKKLLYFSCLSLVSVVLFIAADASAITTLRKVQVTDGSQIDLLFDAKVNPSQIQAEYINDIIQINLNNVSVYPAKIVSVSGLDLTKVFAYQYTPKLVRCRLTVKGKAENYKSRLNIKANGKIVTIKVPNFSNIKEEKAPETSVTEEEKALLDKVIKSQAAPLPIKTVQKSGEKDAKQKSLASGKGLPNPLRSIGVLLAVLSLFFLSVIIVKKFKGPKIEKHKGLSGFLGKFANLGMGRKGKMIEVVATHYLGPKKSIAVVRIAGRLLVLGISNESINLISQLAGNSLDANQVGAVLGAPMENDTVAPTDDFEPLSTLSANASQNYSMEPKKIFSDVLGSEQAKPSVRAQIKSKLEGMKNL
ncbi:MAG: hypothetical protein A3K03_02900 [Bdellovibrionales bacterium RIFOXYD1_FULL_44_7]|nr:MAG: hypothetical protein A3K03_02900 [Bdellovibrionales bacterium RIFOXYD1_FULL_44_7]